LADRTVVVFATDHGAAMPRAKCTLYDPGIEIALLLRWPSLPAGRVVDALVSNVDITPTLLDGLSLPMPSNLHGRSAWREIRGEAAAPREEIFAEKTFHTYYEPMRAVRTERHKLIVNFEASTAVDVPADIRLSPIYPLMISDFVSIRPLLELYDLEADRWERINLALAPEYASIREDLRQRLLLWMQDTDDPLLQGPVSSPYYADAVRVLRGA
jgi:arylsulfatase A-like enzyme